MNDNNEFVQNFDIEPPNVSPAPKKPKQKKKWLIIGIAAVLCIIVTISVIYIKNKSTPFERLLQGYRELFDNSDILSEELGIKEIMESDKSSKNIEFSIDSCQYTPELEGLGINSFTSVNSEKKKLENITGITYCGTAVMSSDIYVKGNKAYIAIPSLFDDVLMIDFSKVEKSKDSSYILQQIPDEFYDEFDMSSLQDIWYIDSDKYNPITIADYIKETDYEDWKTICEGIKVTEVDGSHELKMSISNDSIKLFLEKSIDVLFSNEDYNLYLEELLTKMDGEYTKEELHDKMKNSLSLVSLLIGKNIDVYTTLNSKNQITSIRCNHNFGILGFSMKMKVDMKFTGSKNPKDKYNGDISFTYNEESVRLHLNKANKEKDSTIHTEQTTELFYNDISIGSLNTSSQYKIPKKENPLLNFLGCSKSYDSAINTPIPYETAVTIDSDYVSCGITCKGNISDIVKGETYTLNVNSLSATLNSEELISLSGSYSLNNKAAAMGKPDGETKDLLKLGKKELDSLCTEINHNIEKFKKSYLELTE